MNKLWIYRELVLKIPVIKSLSKHRQSIHKFKKLYLNIARLLHYFAKSPSIDLAFTCQKLLDFLWVSECQFIFWVLTIVICTLCTSTTKKGEKPYSCYVAGCITEKTVCFDIAYGNHNYYFFDFGLWYDNHMHFLKAIVCSCTQCIVT